LVKKLGFVEVNVPETIGPVRDLGARLDELETIVRSLEDDPAMTLDEALRLYETARKLSQSCHLDLARAKLRLIEIDTSIPLDEAKSSIVSDA
jgi:exodeoxyribonuclease VII small subunit